MELGTPDWKNRLACSVIAGLVLVLAIFVNLPYQYVEVQEQWIGGYQFRDTDVDRHSDTLPTMAGWPMRYWIRYELDGRVEDRHWSWGELAANIAIGLLMSGLVFLLARLRHRNIEAATNPRRARRIADIAVAVSILALPMTLAASALHTKSRHAQLMRRTTRIGNTYVSSWVPEVIATRLPTGVAEMFSRIRYVKFVEPSDELVREVVSLDSLTGFEFVGGDYDASSLEGLKSKWRFASLAITDRAIDDAFMELIASISGLVELKLNHTDLDSKQLAKLDSLEGLRWVYLLGTQLRLADLGNPKWSSTVRHLILPRPANRTSDEVTIRDWPALETLAITRPSIILNEAELKITLSNLPQLSRLKVNRVQKHAFILEDLPRLKSIDEDVTSLLYALGSDRFVPGLTWMTQLQLKNLSSLTRINCFARDLDQLSIDHAPNLRQLILGSYLLSAGSARLQTADARQCQLWIDQIGRGEGPAKVDLTGLPLKDVDLSPLVANPRVRKISLGNTGVTFDQIRGLDGMDQLRTLNLGDCDLQDDQFSWLLSHLPKLTELRVNAANIESVELTNLDELRLLNTTRFERLRELRLEDVPELNGQLHLVQAPERMLIRNAQSIRGLAVEQPWPADSVITGLRDLQWFSAGGSELDDTVVEALLNCETVDRLTLAHATISRDKLIELGKLVELTCLILPGSEADDDVTANWHELKMLQEINLDESSISDGTLTWLGEISSLRELSLNRVTLNNDASQALSKLVQLQKLSLVDTKMNVDALIELLEQDTLESLDIAGLAVDAKLVDALAASKSINELGLAGCHLSPAAIRRIVMGNLSIAAIDLGDQQESLPKDLAAILDERLSNRTLVAESSGRILLTVDDSYQLIESDTTPSSDPVSAVHWVLAEERPGSIDTERFRH